MATVEAAPAGKSPGLDGLPYEFYKATFHTIGPYLLAALQAALDRCRLPATMIQGAVRLLPKSPGRLTILTNHSAMYGLQITNKSSLSAASTALPLSPQDSPAMLSAWPLQF